MCAGMFLVLLDVTIVNVALPSIGHGLRAEVAVLQWVVDGYAVAIASLLLAGGTLGDRIGHRRVLLAGFALFGVASLICATAPNVGVLIGGAGRAGRRRGAAAARAPWRSSPTSSRTAPRRPGRSGTWAAVSSLALPAGPLLGGRSSTGSAGVWCSGSTCRWSRWPIAADAADRPGAPGRPRRRA